MADIILLDGRGEPATYSGITVVEFDILKLFFRLILTKYQICDIISRVRE